MRCIFIFLLSLSSTLLIAQQQLLAPNGQRVTIDIYKNLAGDSIILRVGEQFIRVKDSVGIDSLKVEAILRSKPNLTIVNAGPHDTAFGRYSDSSLFFKTFEGFGTPGAFTIRAADGPLLAVIYKDSDGRLRGDTGFIRVNPVTKTLIIPSGATIDFFGTPDRNNNYQKLTIGADSTVFYLDARQNGSALRRPIILRGSQSAIFRVGYASNDSSYFSLETPNQQAGLARHTFSIKALLNNDDGVHTILNFGKSIIRQIDEAGYIMLRGVIRRESLGSGTRELLRLGYRNPVYDSPLLDSIMFRIGEYGRIYTYDNSSITFKSQYSSLWGDSSGFFIKIPKDSLNGNLGPLTSAISLDFPDTGTQLSSDLTMTLTGAIVGDVVILGTPIASVVANTCYTAFVSSNNTVTVRFNNYSSGSANPSPGGFKVSILR